MKPLQEYTFKELVQLMQGKIILAIPKGEFNDAVWLAMEMALQWKQLQKEKK